MGRQHATWLRGVAAAVGVVAATVGVAAATATDSPAPRGSLDDIEHIIVFMQENRAFDHYYGTMRGVRGFADRAAPPLAVNNEIPFYQPTTKPGPPDASSCHGTTCSIQGQHCLPGTPGAGAKELTCCFGTWQPDTTTCAATPPNATSCHGTTCPAVMQGQVCPRGAPGADDHDWVCCFGSWRENQDSCPAFPPPATSCDGAATQQECTVQNQTCPAGAPGAGSRGNRCCGGWWNDAAATPCPADPVSADYMLPFHVNLSATSGECMNAPMMNYPTDIGMWNDGRMDSWNTAREAGYGMSYFVRDDLPYYYSLSDAFVVGDHHFQSTFTQTCPNRMHLFSGANNNLWNATARGSDPSKLWMMMDNTEPNPGFDWPTLGETLEEANVSWKVYMEEDNFDDNGFAWFANFQAARPGDILYEKGMRRVATNTLVDEFEADVAAGTLPSVSWLVAPANQSEHATNHPAAGEDLTARLLAVLQAHPEVYRNTAFVLNYDEGGQFFDHLWPPTPPVSPADGRSTVDTTGEITTTRTVGVPPRNPIGMGFRVPLFVVSPWTRVSGGAVYSEVVDHTSVVQFIERRFNISCPNISPWRRAIAGDLVHAFDFSSPDYSWPVLPNTSSYVADANAQCADLPSPQVPRSQSMPSQEPGTKPARPLPYRFSVADAVALSSSPSSSPSSSLELRMRNVGDAGVVFSVFDLAPATRLDAPRKFTIEAGKELDDAWPAQALGGGEEDHEAGPVFDVALYGPNGFVRRFNGSAAVAALATVAFTEQPASQTVVFEAVAPVGPVVAAAGVRSGARACFPTVEVVDAAYGLGGPWVLAASEPLQINLSASSQWYNFEVTVTDSCNATAGGATFTRTLMGKMEGTGVATTTDPAMGFRTEEPRQHLPVPLHHLNFDKTVPVMSHTRGGLPHQRLRARRDSSSFDEAGVCTENKDACSTP